MGTAFATALEAHLAIEVAGRENAVHDRRVVPIMDVGQVVRQGDVYIHRVADGHKRGAMRRGEDARQVAVGNTVGARHYAMSPSVAYDGVVAPDWCDQQTTAIGPVIASPDRWTLTHPEHAHVEFPAGTYQVTHQIDTRTMRRVQD